MQTIVSFESQILLFFYLHQKTDAIYLLHMERCQTTEKEKDQAI